MRWFVYVFHLVSLCQRYQNQTLVLGSHQQSLTYANMFQYVNSRWKLRNWLRCARPQVWSRLYAGFTPNSRGHTWFVTALLAVSKKVPWFNLFYRNWYIIYISWPISRTVRHLTTPLSTVMYRTVSLSKPFTQKATWAQSIATHGCSVWTQH